MPAAFDHEYVKRLDGDNMMRTINKRHAQPIREDIHRFRDEKRSIGSW